jgi:hypothetical protein
MLDAQSRLDPAEEPMTAHLDRLEDILTAKDIELRRMRTELDLRNLYVSELHAVLRRQAAQLVELEERLRRLEAGVDSDHRGCAGRQ